MLMTDIFRRYLLLLALICCLIPVQAEVSDSSSLENAIILYDSLDNKIPSNLHKQAELLNHRKAQTELNFFEGNFYLRRGRYDSATLYLVRSLEMAKEAKLNQLIPRIHRSLGSVYKRQRNWSASERHFYRALDESKELNDPIAISDTEYALATYYWDRHFNNPNESKRFLDSCAYYANRCIKRSKEAGYSEGIADGGLIMAAMASERDDYKSVKTHSARSLKLYKKLGKRTSLSACLHNLGVASWNLNQSDSASYYFSQAELINKKYGLEQNMLSLYRNLTEFHIDINNPDSAQIYFAKFQQLNRIVEDKERDRNSKVIEEEYQLDLLKAEKQAQSEKHALEIKNSRIVSLFLIAGLLLVAFFLINVYFSRKSIHRAKERSDELLLNIIPEKIADELKKNGYTKPRYFKDASILFADIENFTLIAETLSAKEVIDMLDEYFSVFDEELAGFGIEKIKTIGDAYMAASGIPEPNVNHAYNMACAAIKLQDRIKAINESKKIKSEKYFSFRMGIHSGPVVAGIVGKKKFQYDVWGDTVNTAARIEEAGKSNKVNISFHTYELVKNRLNCESRGKLPAKNKGEIDMYFVYSNNSTKVTEQKYNQFVQEITAFLRERLDNRLSYHGLHHTMYVLKVAQEIGAYENISEHEMLLLKTAAVLHDSGFIEVYNGHEEKGCKIASEILPKYGFSPEDIKRIQGMIMATKIPQTPKNLLENIIADADLEYLGTDTFDETSATLFKEWKSYEMIASEEAWMNAQINFISKHKYFTDYCKKFRTDKKLANLNKLLDSDN